MKKKQLLFIALILFLLFGAVFSFHKQTQPTTVQPTENTITPTTTQSVLGASIMKRTKTSGCFTKQGLPDESCTPGQMFEGVTKDQICVSGYSKSVRNVPESEKKEVYIEYEIVTHTKNEYEVDHLISLELGGSNDISNLWPESAEPRPGFHEKDKVENYLHKLVCNGQMSLNEAQIKIAHNWKEFLPLIQN